MDDPCTYERPPMPAGSVHRVASQAQAGVAAMICVYIPKALADEYE